MKSSSPGVKENVLKDVQRTAYDTLSHWNFSTGAIGSPQTLACIPVVAGDSFELDINAVIRLSPLRRNLYLDAVVDIFGFYVPHRHIYGQDWIDFILGGYDEAITLTTDTLAANAKLDCVSLRTNTAGVLPAWLTRGYIQIWNRYFRDPNDTSGLLAENYFTTLADTSTQLLYGIPACHLKTLWSASMTSNLTTADYRSALSGGEVDLLDLAVIKGRLQSEQARDYFGVRYNDLLGYSWGTHVNIDADKRPELVMRSSTWLSGYDVDGTDAGTLGTYSGKAQALCKMHVPRKFFPEHGTLWVMALVRFPAINANETHYLALKSQPTYAQIAGDPAVVGRNSPTAYNLTDIFADASSVTLGNHPHSQYYRLHPSTVHRDYTSLVTGHPFLSTYPASKVAATYIGQTDYDAVFQSLQLKHWNSQTRIGIKAHRYIPDPQQSIFAGVRN